MACCDRPTYIKRIEKITKKEIPPSSRQSEFNVAAPTISYDQMTRFVTPAEPSGSQTPGATPVVPAPTPNGAPDGSMPDTMPRTENTPTFVVPQSPLTPPGYRELIDMNQIQYLQGFYQTQIGRFVRVEHLMGTNVVQTELGFLVGVGINYIVLQAADTPNITIVDMYSIKSVKVYYGTIDFA